MSAVSELSKFHPIDGHPVVFVDTPGFNDTYNIPNWLGKQWEVNCMELSPTGHWSCRSYKEKTCRPSSTCIGSLTIGCLGRQWEIFECSQLYAAITRCKTSFSWGRCGANQDGESITTGGRAEGSVPGRYVVLGIASNCRWGAQQEKISYWADSLSLLAQGATRFALSVRLPRLSGSPSLSIRILITF
jgi:hypothetical protein